MQVVIETRDFLRDAEDAGIEPAERAEIVEAISANPRAGDLIVGTGGARKVRFAGRGKGKSGGYRVITFFGGEDIPVFLLNVFSKGDRANTSKAERNEMRDVLRGLADDYRASVRQRTQIKVVK